MNTDSLMLSSWGTVLLLEPCVCHEHQVVSQEQNMLEHKTFVSHVSWKLFPHFLKSHARTSDTTKVLD